MRALTLTLFILGFTWAFLCIGLVLMAPMWLLEFITHEHHIPTGQLLLGTPIILLISANAVFGYWIWVKWLQYARRGRFGSTSESKFWKLAATNNLAWLLLLPLFFNLLNVGTQDSAFKMLYWRGGLFGWPYLIWPLLVGALSIWLRMKAKQHSLA